MLDYAVGKATWTEDVASLRDSINIFLKTYADTAPPYITFVIVIWLMLSLLWFCWDVFYSRNYKRYVGDPKNENLALKKALIEFVSLEYENARIAYIHLVDAVGQPEFKIIDGKAVMPNGSEWNSGISERFSTPYQLRDGGLERIKFKQAFELISSFEMERLVWDTSIYFNCSCETLIKDFENWSITESRRDNISSKAREFSRKMDTYIERFIEIEETYDSILLQGTNISWGIISSEYIHRTLENTDWYKPLSQA